MADLPAHMYYMHLGHRMFTSGVWPSRGPVLEHRYAMGRQLRWEGGGYAYQWGVKNPHRVTPAS